MGRAPVLPLPEKRMLTAQEAAEYCGFKSVDGFTGYIPARPVKFGKNVRYDKEDLDEILNSLRGDPIQGQSPSEIMRRAGQNRGH